MSYFENIMPDSMKLFVLRLMNKTKHSLQDEKNLEKHPKYAVYESELRDARLNQKAN